MSIIEFRGHSISTEIAVKKQRMRIFYLSLATCRDAPCSCMLRVSLVNYTYGSFMTIFAGSSSHPTQLGGLSQRTLCVRSLIYLRMC
jgi:hypothetical protein